MPNDAIARSGSIRVNAPVAVFTPSPRNACRAPVVLNADPQPQPDVCSTGISGGTTVVRGRVSGPGADTNSPPSSRMAASVTKYSLPGSRTQPSPAPNVRQNCRTAPHGVCKSDRGNTVEACSVPVDASNTRARQDDHARSSSRTSK
ncbi:MAG: hypothetical protein HOV94_39860 [Saccharothrix sp.]|nr:hypothetical protein [Saccharothrix sp.]